MPNVFLVGKEKKRVRKEESRKNVSPFGTSHTHYSPQISLSDSFSLSFLKNHLFCLWLDCILFSAVKVSVGAQPVTRPERQRLQEDNDKRETSEGEKNA